MSDRLLLLVEREPDVREVVAELLEQEGWRVVQCASESTAIAVLPESEWEALLAHLGTVHSGELLRRARRLLPRMRIVVMTAGTGLSVPDGADALLLKPFSARQLHAALDSSQPGWPARRP